MKDHAVCRDSSQPFLLQRRRMGGGGVVGGFSFAGARCFFHRPPRRGACGREGFFLLRALGGMVFLAFDAQALAGRMAGTYSPFDAVSSFGVDLRFDGSFDSGGAAGYFR